MKKNFRKFGFISLIFCCFCTCAFADIASTRKVLSNYCKDNPNVLEMYDKSAKSWSEYEKKSKGEWDLEKLLKAIEYAAKKHERQVRKNIEKTPYIIHPIGVAELIWNVGNVRSINVLISAILHDTLEDTDAKENEIKTLFGPRVLYTVKELTNDSNLSTEENKQRQVDHASSMSLDAQLVKLADRLYNVKDLKNPPLNWSIDKINNYYDWGEKLLKSLKGTNETLEIALEEEIRNHKKFYSNVLIKDINFPKSIFASF